MFKKLPLVFVLGTLLSASNAFALGVGDIKVHSALNQRLNAEIELLSSVDDELDNVTVKLASPDAFERLKLARPYQLSAIKFTVTTRADGTPIIRLTTKENIREPFLDFLIDIDWPKGHMIREYTVLLDPPVVIAEAPAKPASKPVAASMAEAADTKEPVITSLEQPVEATISEPNSYEESSTVATGQTDELGFPIYGTATDQGVVSSRPSYEGETYGPVAANETLWSIATQVRADSASNQQMMLALYEANPDAFVNGDIHNVKRGAVLRIPDEATQTSRSQSEALNEVRQLNSAIGVSPDVTAAVTREQPGLPDVSEPEITNEPEVKTDSKLSLIEPADAAASDAGTAASTTALKRELALARDRLTSESMKNEELTSRVKELESSVAAMDKLKRLLELQSEEMAQLQQQLAEAEAAGSATPGAVTDTNVTADAIDPDTKMDKEAVSTALKDLADALPDKEAAEKAAQAGKELEKSLEELKKSTAELEKLGKAVEEKAAEEKAAEVVEKVADAGAGTDVTTYAVDDKAPAAEAPAPLPPAVKKSPMDIVMDLVDTAKDDPMALVDKLKKDPVLMGIVGGLLFVLIALIVLVLKRSGGASAEPKEKPAKKEKSGVALGAKVGQFKDKIQGMLKKKPKAESEEAEDPQIDLGDMFPDEENTATQIHDEPPVAEAPDVGSDQTILEAPSDSGAADAMADMAFEEDTSAEAPEEEAAPEGPDPLEEVDVYEAFGDFDQAAEIVKLAIADAPDNNDYKLRLFTVYNGGGMSDDYATAAVQYQSAMEGTPQWDSVVEMGKAIAPDCPAWGDSQSSPALPASDAGDMANTMAMDVSDLQSVEAAAENDATVADVNAELDTGSLDMGADDPIADMTPVAPSAPLGDSNEMEFDLGDMDFEPADETAADVTENTEALDADNSLDMGMDFESADDEIGDSTEVIPEAADDNSLDFGMDETATIDEPAAEETASADDNELEFDLGDISLDISGEAAALDVEDSISEGSEGLDMVSETVQVSDVTADKIEASATEGLSEDPTVMPEVADEEEEVDTSLGVDLSDFSFDMDDSSNQDALIAEDEDLGLSLDSDGDADSDSADLGLDDMSLDMGGETGGDDLSLDDMALDIESGSSDDGLSMDDMSLDMEAGSEDPTLLMPDDSGDSDSISSEGNEVSTKLDLARAYIDMGDAEGARGILEEVVAEGNDAQKAEAEQLLQQA